jgi:hypothetical protein
MSKNRKKWTSDVQNYRRNYRKYKSIEKRTIINPDTGEFTEKKRYIDSLYSKRGYVLKYNNDYIKLFLDKGLPDECSLVDCGKFYKLIRYIVGENQLLGYRSGNINPLTINKMSELFSCSERQTRRFLKQMKDYKVIKEVCINDVKWYAVNPLYALKSKYLSLTTFIIFQEELMPILPNWVIQNFMQEAQEILDKVEIKK